MSEVVNSKVFFFIGPQNCISGIQWTITFRKPFNINNFNKKKILFFNIFMSTELIAVTVNTELMTFPEYQVIRKYSMF